MLRVGPVESARKEPVLGERERLAYFVEDILDHERDRDRPLPGIVPSVAMRERLSCLSALGRRHLFTSSKSVSSDRMQFYKEPGFSGR